MTALPTNEKPVVAAFDFDGTITKRDTLLSFLLFSAGKSPAIRKLVKLSPSFIGYALSQLSRQEMKERVLKRFFGGMPMSQLRDLGEAFAKSDALKRLVLPGALKRLDWHRRQKHRCILISASIDAYLEPWSEMIGFDDLICSKMEVDQYGIVTGHLQGTNCWGPEKTSRLENLIGPLKDHTLYAYGDSKGDKDLLSNADFPFFRKIPST